MFKAICYRNLSIEDAEIEQEEFEGTLTALERYDPRKSDYKTARYSLLLNARNLYDKRKMIIDEFKNKIFPFGVKEPEDSGKRPDESDKSNKSDEIDEFSETISELSNFENEEEAPRDMSELKSEESVEQGRKAKGRGFKILIPEQILSRMPISLAQLKAGDNSEKLKNKIRELLYSLYRSKKLSKTIYKHLVNPII